MKVLLSVGRSITHALKLFFSTFYGQRFRVGNSKTLFYCFKSVFISTFYEFILSDDETK